MKWKDAEQKDVTHRVILDYTRCPPWQHLFLDVWPHKRIPEDVSVHALKAQLHLVAIIQQQPQHRLVI